MEQIKERPILFSAPMVNAILRSEKTMTRRAVKYKHDLSDFNSASQAGDGSWILWTGKHGANQEEFTKKAYPSGGIYCPQGKPGDRLWVRENYRFSSAHDDLKPSQVSVGDTVEYFADTTAKHYLDGKQRPSIFMPRWASRINLEITGIKVERLQDISREDARKEGLMVGIGAGGLRDSRHMFEELWDSINGKTVGKSWNDNPFVWVLSFFRITDR